MHRVDAKCLLTASEIRNLSPRGCWDYSTWAQCWNDEERVIMEEREPMEGLRVPARISTDGGMNWNSFLRRR